MSGLMNFETWRRWTHGQDSSLFRKLTNLTKNRKNTNIDSLAELDKKSTDVANLYAKLNRYFFKKMNEKRFSDVIRIAHIVTLEVKDKDPEQLKSGKEPEMWKIKPSDMILEEKHPDKIIRQMKRMIIIIRTLASYFVEHGKKGEKANEAIAESINGYLSLFLHRYERGKITKKDFNLATLFDELQREFGSKEELVCIKRMKKTLKFLHISVVIAAIQEIRTKLKLEMKHLTKDIRADRGWQIFIKLNDAGVEIRHVRREEVLRKQGEGDRNYWEIEYQLTANFDPAMKFQTVKVAVTDLVLHQEMEEGLANELKAKFYNGTFSSSYGPGSQ